MKPQNIQPHTTRSVCLSLSYIWISLSLSLLPPYWDTMLQWAHLLIPSTQMTAVFVYFNKDNIDVLDTFFSLSTMARTPLQHRHLGSPVSLYVHIQTWLTHKQNKNITHSKFIKTFHFTLSFFPTLVSTILSSHAVVYT